MNGLRNFLSCLLFFGITAFLSTDANAQCNQLSIKIVSGSERGCEPHAVSYQVVNNSSKTISSWLWKFGDGSQSNAEIGSRSYPTRGTYVPTVTVTFSDGSSCTIAYGGNIVVYGKPEPIINLPTETVQCLSQNGIVNSFCFTESSKMSDDNAPIEQWLWTFGDGDDTVVYSPGQVICHSYQAGGKYDVRLTVIDSNGCQETEILQTAIHVLHELKPRYEVSVKKYCDSAVATFTNLTDTNGTHLKDWYWDFGDGDRDSVNWKVTTHTYKDDPNTEGPDTGKYNVTLRLINRLNCDSGWTCKGCTEYFRPRIKLKVPDTVCWAEAKEGLEFEAEPVEGANTWLWNMDDAFPTPNPQNVKFFQWNVSHEFINGPKNYQVRFTVIHPVCGTMDTCVVLHVMGPQATITLPPPPPNNFFPPEPMDATDFYSALDPCQGVDSIPYFTQIVYGQQNVPTYCNPAKLDSTLDTLAYCDGDTQFYKQYTYQPTGTKTVSTGPFVDGTSLKYWEFGDPLPPVAYFSHKGNVNYQIMHDSNLYTCEMPNLVRFTNNSKKYRLYSALDNTPPGGFPDTCKHPSYPFASDSMTYLWSFMDPCGLPCTSSVNNPNIYCNFSTLNAPLHYYSCNTSPASGCQNAMLVVWDTIKGKEIDHIDSTEILDEFGNPTGEYDYDTVVTMTKTFFCQDTATQILRQGPPNAWWDKTAFNTMNHDLQKILPFGEPGNPNKPLLGFVAGHRRDQCPGEPYHYPIDFSQTIPVCQGQKWWIIWDWDQAVKEEPCPSNPNTTYTNIPWDGAVDSTGWPIAGPNDLWMAPPFSGEYWYINEEENGPKTVGVKIQIGECVSIAKYDAYFLFKKMSADFGITNYGGKIWDANLGDSVELKVKVTDTKKANIKGICRFGSDTTETAGVTIKLSPYYNDLEQITRYVYTVTRRELPGDDYYYDRPFWPDTATLPQDIFTEKQDSITSVLQYYYIPADSILQTNFYNAQGQVLGTIPLVGEDIPLSIDEYNSLAATDEVEIPLSDFRARKYSFSPDSFVTIETVPGKMLSIVDTVNILNLYDTISNGPDIPLNQDTVTFHLPYPGFYTINSVSENLQGCGSFEDFHLIYGHFARFHATTDTFICTGDTVKFDYLIRYWTDACPPVGGFFPDGCINGLIAGELDYYTDVLKPWDVVDPAQHRQDLMPINPETNLPYQWGIGPGGYQNETFAWNFGDDTYSPDGNLRNDYEPNFTDPTTGSGLSTVQVKEIGEVWHVFNKPGIFDVTMKTTDSSGCTIYTKRHNFIKVVGLQADLRADGDTFLYCTPQTITFYDTSKFLGTETDNPRKFGYKERVVSNGQIVDTIIVLDSFYSWTWDPGTGVDPITRYDDDTVKFTYPEGGTFDVSLFIRTKLGEFKPMGCTSDILKEKYITISTAQPKLAIDGDTFGCAPFKVIIENQSDSAFYYEWTWGDGSVEVHTSYQPVVEHIYTTPGEYSISLFEKKRIYDPFTGDTIECSVTFPHIDSPKVLVKVFRADPFTTIATDTVCVGNPANFLVVSQHGEYGSYQYIWGDGEFDGPVPDSVMTHVYNEEGTFDVIVKAITKEPVVSPCEKYDTVTVHVIPPPNAQITDISIPEQANIGKFAFSNSSNNQGQGAVTYTWYFSDDYSKPIVLSDTSPVTHEFKPSKELDIPEQDDTTRTPYTVSLVAVNNRTGCKDSVTIPVEVKRVWKRYNVITPNGDGMNDFFDPKIAGHTKYELQIFNRWGEKVFESTDSDIDWNGNNNQTGGESPAGTYYYIWNFTLIGGIDKSETGIVTLLRE